MDDEIDIVIYSSSKTNTAKAQKFRFKYSFICEGTRPGDSEGTFLVFESSCHLLLPV